MPRRGFRAYDGSHAPKPPFTLNKDSPQAQALFGWWPMQAHNSVPPRDLSGYGNHGVLVGEPSKSASERGLVLDLDGVNDAIDLGQSSVLDFDPATEAGSMSAWVKATTQPGNFNIIIGDWSDTIQEFGIWISNTTNIAGFCGGEITSASSGVDLSGEWQHVLVTNDADGSGEAQKIYVDGLLKDSGISGTELDTTNGFVIGYRQANNDRFFKGLIDDVRVYRRELTAGEIWSLYSPSTRWDLYWQRQRTYFFVAAAPVGGRIMSSLAKTGGLAGPGGIAGQGGGLAG